MSGSAGHPAQPQEAAESWHMLIAEADFPAEGKLATIINRWHVLVARTDEGLFALNDRCTHQGPCSLRGGSVAVP